jgi:hypothetical protein
MLRTLVAFATLVAGAAAFAPAGVLTGRFVRATHLTFLPRGAAPAGAV